MSLDVGQPPAPPTTANTGADSRRSPARTVWNWLWPKALAVGLVLALWQAAIWTEWKPPYILPSPSEVFGRLAQELRGDGVTDKTLWDQLALTMRRGVSGYALAIAIGTMLGIAVVQWRAMRLAVGSLIAGLQTMPSIAWFPLAILFFGLSENAILFVVVLGAAPSIASGVITCIGEVPPPLLCAGHMLGARGVDR